MAFSLCVSLCVSSLLIRTPVILDYGPTLLLHELSLTYIFFFLINVFIYLFGWVGFFVAARRLSLVAASGGYSLLWSAGFSLQWLLFVVEYGL